jgi:hypothetical protein
MRIYSNILLSLPHIVHVLNKPYTGQWGNLYTFRPLGISNSQRSNVKSGHTFIALRHFIHLLEKDRKYYCYDTFYRNKYIEKFGNISRIITDKNTCIYIPQFSMADDIFIIKDDNPSHDHITLPKWLKFYSPPLL